MLPERFLTVKLPWYPNHMRKGLEALDKLKINFVIEVRDARAPATTANKELLQRIRKKAGHLLVLNKSDLVPEEYLKKWCDKLDGVPIMARNQKYVSEILKKVTKIGETKILVAGLPNVGKSTLINSLRNLGMQCQGKAVTIGGIPGITRHTGQLVKIQRDPKVFILDTPGIITPRALDSESILKLALLNCIPENSLDQYLVADYLLYILKRAQNKEYLDFFRCIEPNDIIDFLPIVCQRIGALAKGKVFDEQKGLWFFLRRYGKGKFGKIPLD